MLKQGNKLTVLRSPVSSQSMFRLNAKDARALKKEEGSAFTDSLKIAIAATKPFLLKQILKKHRSSVIS